MADFMPLSLLKLETGGLRRKLYSVALSAGEAILYVGKLKDPATGEFIINQGLGLDLFVVMDSDFDKGQSFIGVVQDDPNGGFINMDHIIL